MCLESSDAPGEKLATGVEIEDHRYELVPDRRGGLALEPAVTTTVSELDRRHGTRPATEEEIEAQFGRLPRDGEG
jgi:hypothetical protein